MEVLEGGDKCEQNILQNSQRTNEAFERVMYLCFFLFFNSLQNFNTK